MRVFIKVRFNSKLPKFEKVLNNKYILYTPESQNSESEKFIAGLLAHKIGVREENVYFVMVDDINGWVFDIDN